MRKFMTNRSLFLALTIILFSNSIIAQNLITSRKTSNKTYIYKLTDKEALKINKHNVNVIDSTYFHTMVDSYPTDSVYKGKLAAGHYLKTCSYKNKQQTFYTYIPDFDVKILNNNTDLCIQVYDLTGKLIPNAIVRIGLTTLRFDGKTQCYLDKKSNKKGVLKVSYNGGTAYFQLNRRMNNPALLRGARKVVFATPLKYIWVPLNFVINIPFDGVKSIVKGRPQGVIWRINHFFSNLWDNIIDPSDKNSLKQNYQGYMVLNKPKYLPGDTVKMKAYIVNKKGKPLNKTVVASLYNGKKYIQLAELTPYNKGAYDFKFFLHDSLNLKLDRYYNLDLDNKQRNTYMSTGFRYEDYELKSTKLALRTESNTQYKGKSLKVYAKGTDENDLNLLDARIEITLKTTKVSDSFDKVMFVPDTLWKHSMQLKPTGETEIQVPDSIFPKANMTYEMEVMMFTSDNKNYKERKTINYYYSRKNFDMNVVADSLTFSYTDNGEPKQKAVTIYATDNFGNNTPICKGLTPCNVPLNVFFGSYTIQCDSLKQTFDLKKETPQLQCISERTKDSVLIVVQNPRKLNFTYNIYKHNTEETRGSGDSLTYKKAITTKQNYYISMRYLWGGSIKEETFRIPFYDKKLNIAVKQPRLVYPGQKTDIEVTVTDQNGKAVEGVDLTAYSMTKKFNNSAPTLPYMGKQAPGKEVINNFNFKNKDLSGPVNRILNYQNWKALAGIDTIEYYKFLYPGNSIYRYEYPTSDKTTQFAPFVVSRNGDLEQIHVIYVDNRPVYFSWSTVNQPYSFRIDSGLHQLRLRLHDREITLNKVRFNLQHKTIICLQKDLTDKHVNIKNMPTSFAGYEKQLVNCYTFPYRNNFGENFAYLEDGNNIQLLNQGNSNYYSYNIRNFAGPVLGNVTAGIVDGYSLNFNHESNFEYEMSPKILKMREINDKNLPSACLLSAYGDEKKLSDTILTSSIVRSEYKKYLEMKRRQKARYNNPYYTRGGFGKLKIETEPVDNESKKPLNLVFMRYDTNDFTRVYPGSETMIHQLAPGNYKMIVFYPGSYYHVTDFIEIMPNGTTYFKYKTPEKLTKDSFSLKVNKLIESTIFGTGMIDIKNNYDFNQIQNFYMQQYPYTGEGETITGKVYDQKTGEPIIGASIVVKGTNYGTVSNVDGTYTLKVPSDKHIIRVTYIGYIVQELDLRQTTTTSVGLKEDSNKLDEVVVVGYGSQKKSDMTGSITTVSAQSLNGIVSIDDALQGRVAGVVSVGNSGDKANFYVRGISGSDQSKMPLYIVDGSVYTGDFSKLDPSLVETMEVLKDEQATAIYGARAANGVIMITTKGNALKTTLAKQNKGADYDQSFLEAASKANSIRSNFSDYAFWQPRLVTDKNGKATFTTTFPDDVTSWQTYILAMNDKKQSGQTSGNIKSYKPLMAQLAVPNFLVENDTAMVIGKALNYLPDSVQIKTGFEVNAKNSFNATRFCVNSTIDSLQVVAPSDSLTLRYTLSKTDGYFDGEQRKVPVFPIGLEETKGTFAVLDKDTTFSPAFDLSNGEVTLYAHADYLNILNDEISRIINYKYYCNEQIASKLKALLAKRTIAQYTGKKVNNDGEIEKLIRLLLKNRKSDGLWGWWKDSETHYEFSAHILEALSQAKKQGFKVEIDATKLAQLFVTELESNNHANLSKDIFILKMLKAYDCVVDYKGYIEELDKVRKKEMNNQLNLIELKQQCGLPYKTDSLKAIQQSTMFGNIYFRDEKSNVGLMSNDIQNTLISYRILRNDHITNDSVLAKIRRYFLEKKQSFCWWNTYESAQIIETILPDILKNNVKWKKATLKLSGDINKTVTDFPLELKLKANQKISITKTGSDPVYMTTYQHTWNKTPNVKGGNFVINTRFEDTKEQELKAGKSTKLIVTVDVKKDADYVMLEIPIPAGCSYGDKTQYYRNEVHREYFKNETNIFCQKLRKGTYTFEINLLARFSGKYTLNPAKVELMYFPVFNANNELKKVTIK